MVLNNSQFFKETDTYMYMYPIYTHGGPYWQSIQIPFSKFFSVTHGRLSDRQNQFSEIDISSVGFTCMDGIEGPFSFDIDFIGLLKDNSVTEKFPYETYDTPKFVTNT